MEFFMRMPDKDDGGFEPFCFKNAGGDEMKLFLKIMSLHRSQMKAFRRMMSGYDIHHVQSFCLKIISVHEGLNQSELAEFMHIERATATTMLQRMENSGLIIKKPDPGDQRIIRLYLSEKGRKIKESVEELFADFINSCYNIPKEEKNIFIGCIDGIAERIRSYGPGTSKELKTDEDDN